MRMSNKMLYVVIDARKEMAYCKYYGKNGSDVIAKQVEFWDLTEEETEYLIQELLSE